MKGAFEVISLVFADYVTQDHTGKQILVGMYLDHMGFSAPPTNWPPLFICAAIKPLKSSFPLSVDFDSPKGRICRLFGTVNVTTPIRSENVINLNFQCAAVPFPGEGKYTATVSDGNRVIHRQILQVTAHAVPAIQMNFDGRIEVGQLAAT